MRPHRLAKPEAKSSWLIRLHCQCSPVTFVAPFLPIPHIAYSQHHPVNMHHHLQVFVTALPQGP